MDQPAIDAVIAWVDGDDPAHRAKRARFGAEARASHRRATHATRFASRGEVHWCIRSILRYLPQVRHVVLLTDAQVPPGLDAYPQGRIRVVDHREAFAGLEEALPTFNVRSIEAVLWRIPGLAEQFVYFNDDFFLNRPLVPADFFDDCGLPVLRGWLHRARPPSLVGRTKALLRRLGLVRTRPAYFSAQALAARLAGAGETSIRMDHHPHAMRRSTLRTFFEAHPDLLRAQVAHRFRSAAQFSPTALATHLEWLRHGADLREQPAIALLDYSQGHAPAEALEAIRRGTVPFGCIQSLDAADAAAMAQVTDLMEAKFPPPSCAP